MPTHRDLRAIPIALVLLSLGTACATRDVWQRPDTVIGTLEIAQGSRVADVGAGDGYFVPYLSRAVGPDGTVYAVEVDADAIAALETFVAERRLTNVRVVHAPYDDPSLPDGVIDLVFLCNTYHHIEDRPAYFTAVRRDLRAGGRVAVLDPDEDATAPVAWLLDEGHTSRATDVRDEMQQAGYAPAASHDFLLTQIFEIFVPSDGERP